MTELSGVDGAPRYEPPPPPPPPPPAEAKAAPPPGSFSDAQANVDKAPKEAPVAATPLADTVTAPDPAAPAAAPKDPAPEPPSPEAQAKARQSINASLDESGFLFGIFNSVTRDEVSTATKALTTLSPTDRSAVIRDMRSDGSLNNFIAKSDRLDPSEREAFTKTLAQQAKGADLVSLDDAYRVSGPADRRAFLDAVGTQSSPEAKLDYIRARTTEDVNDPALKNLQPPSGPGLNAPRNSAAVAQMIASMRGKGAADAFNLLTPQMRKKVLEGGTRPRFLTAAERDKASQSFDNLMQAAGSIPDPAQRGGVLSDSIATIDRMAEKGKIAQRTSATMAQSVLNQVKDGSLSQIPPERMASLAGQLAKGVDGPGQSLQTINAMPVSAERDALARTVFLKTPEYAYKRDPTLAFAMGRGLAQAGGTQNQTEQQIGDRARDLGQTLKSDAGRALLTSEKVDPSARLWAAREITRDPTGMRDALAQGDKPWENGEILQRYGQARFDQFAARGDRAVPVAGTDIDNLVGAGLRAPPRADLPSDKAELADLSAKAAKGEYNYYQNVPMVEKVGTGIREAQTRMGGGDIAVATLPIQFSSEDSGPVDLQIYRVDGGNGQSRYVDNIGRVYDSMEAWRTQNELPPGKMTYAENGNLGGPEGTKLVTENTPKVSDTFWEHVRDVADVAALAGGVVASGVIILGSGGTATPLVAGAWGVALSAAAYEGGKAIYNLNDRAGHGQTLSLADPDARAAWLSLAASGLTVGGAGMMKGASALVTAESRLAPAAARAAGILNASANWAGAATTVDQAHALVSNWQDMTPLQRTQMGLSIAFWGGMTGVSARASGGGVTDMFSFRANINRAMIDTGAAIRANPALEGGAVSVRTSRDANNRITDISVEHAPDASRLSIDIHKQVAHDLVTNDGASGAMRRAFGKSDAYAPGSRGEETALEVTKHQALVSALEGRQTSGKLSPAETAESTAMLQHYRRDLAVFERELADIRANPELGKEPGFNRVDGRKIAAQAQLDDPTHPITDGPRAQIPRVGTPFELTPAVKARFPDAVEMTPANLQGDKLVYGGKTIGENGGPNAPKFKEWFEVDAARKPLTDPESLRLYGGKVFYDPKSDTVIYAGNIPTARDNFTRQFVEIPYVRDMAQAGVVREPDFGRFAVETVQIVADPKGNRTADFKASNVELLKTLTPEKISRLGLDADAVAMIRRSTESAKTVGAESPGNYTWHHDKFVAGAPGEIKVQLVDHDIHAILTHRGTVSKTKAGGAP